MSESFEPAPSGADPASSWEAHVCVRCEKEFMLQLGAAEGGCPHCGAPASLSAKRREPGTFARLTTPRGRQTRARRKRKVHSEEDLGWERQGKKLAGKQGEVSEVLTSMPGVPRGIRLKRVRRKKLPGRWEKLSAKLGVWGIGVIAVIGAGLIYFTLHTLLVVAASDSDPANRPTVDLGPDTNTLDEGGVPTIVTAEEKAACVAVANHFYAAESVAEKLAYVRQPERVRPLMEACYLIREHETEQIAEVVFEKKRTVDGRRFITLAVKLEGGESRIISFEQASGDAASVLLDWEVSVGYQAMSLAEFRKAKPAEAVPFRVLVNTGEDYRAPFEDPEQYQCVRLTYPGNKEFELTGYIDRDAAWASGFLAKLEFGAASVILELKFPEGAPSDRHVEVLRLVHDSWFY